MSRSLILTCFCLLFGTVGSAQLHSVEESFPRKSFIIQYATLQHLNHFRPSFRLGFEKKIIEPLGVNIDAGYIHQDLYLFSIHIDQPELRSRSGYHFSVEPKWYFLLGRGTFEQSLYFSLSFSMDEVEEELEREVWRFGQSYLEEITYDRTLSHRTYLISMGKTITEWKRFNIAASMAMGVRQTVISASVPEDAEEYETGAGFFRNGIRRRMRRSLGGEFNRPAMVLGLSLTY